MAGRVVVCRPGPSVGVSIDVSIAASWGWPLDLMWKYPTIIAHRGGGTLAPENTLAALRCAFEHGFSGVEFDVMSVADGGLVLMHDTELGRTIPGEGPVSARTATALAGMDAGSWLGDRWRGEPVPGFAEAAGFCIGHGLRMNAEIKPVPGWEVDTGRRVALACAALPAGSVLLSSFSLAALQAAREIAPELPRALLVGDVPDDWDVQLDAVGAIALHARADRLNAAQVDRIKSAGVGLMAYTVNDPLRARELLTLGVDALCTDRLDLIPADFG